MSFKAIYNNRRHTVRHCSNSAPFIVCGNTSGYGIPRGMVKYGAFRVFTVGKRSVHLDTPEYGSIMSADDADRLDMETGRSVPYTRNCVSFVMSRAARKRGFTTSDYRYLNAQKRNAR